MPNADPRHFKRLEDGTLLQRQADGSYAPPKLGTDRARLDRLTDDEIERMATDDSDHPALDDAFWADVDASGVKKEAVSLELDGDVLSYFRRQGRGYATRINDVLRAYVADARRTTTRGSK